MKPGADEKGRFFSIFLAGATLAAAGCGHGRGEDLAGPTSDLCASNWQIIYSSEQQLISIPPHVLRWHEGRLFTSINQVVHPTLISIPDTGGPATTLLEQSSWSFWIEDQTLLYAATGDPVRVNGVLTAPTFLYSMPIGGGPSTSVVETHFWELADPLIEGWALDGEALYWLRMDYASPNEIWTLWRSRRDGSGAGDEQVATLSAGPADQATLFENVAPLADRFLVYTDTFSFGRIVSVPRDGSGPLELPVVGGGHLISVDDQGTALWVHYTGGASPQKGSDHYELGRYRIGDTAVQPFWQAKPPSALPRNAWADGHGGSLVDTWEWGTDGGLHTTIWRLGPDGNAQRLACDPVDATFIAAAAVAPDALYVIVQYSNYWEIAKISTTATGGGPGGS